MKEMSINDWVWAELLGDMQIICELVSVGMKQTLPKERIWAKQTM